MLKLNRERSERRIFFRKFSVLGIKNHWSAAVRGGRAPGAPPPLDPLVRAVLTENYDSFNRI